MISCCHFVLLGGGKDLYMTGTWVIFNAHNPLPYNREPTMSLDRDNEPQPEVRPRLHNDESHPVHITDL